MKSFLRGVLTIIITGLLFTLGIVLSIKGLLLDTTDQMLKKELKTSIVETVKEYQDISNKAIKELGKTIDENKTLKKLMSTYYDKVLEVLSDKDSKVNINVEEELNTLIDETEDILKDYGITLSKEEKEELLSLVSSSEINEYVNESIYDLKQDIPSDVQKLIDIFAFLSSTTFKILVIVFILVSLVCISLLKKNTYGWLSNFGISSIIVGMFFGILMPKIIDIIFTNEDINLSTVSLTNYGYTLLILGVLAIIIKIIIGQVLKNKKEIELNN